MADFNMNNVGLDQKVAVQTPADPSAEVKGMQVTWDIVQALKNTNTMRQAGQKYLPKRKLEEYSEYKARLLASTLYPVYTETVSKMTGRVFAAPMTINDDVPPWIADEVLNNIDLQDHDVQVFSRQWFFAAFDMGHACVLVEAPTTVGTTQAEQKASGARPYTILVTPDRIMGWRADDKGNLRQIRIKFSREVDDGKWGTKMIPQIRVYEMRGVNSDGTGDMKCHVDVYEEQATQDKGKKEWVLNGSLGSVIDLPRIPIITYYTKQTGFMTSEPAALQLAYLNVQYWQIKSALDSLLNVVMVPILTLSGVDEMDKLVMGEKYAIKLPQGAEMKYVEHTGKAIESGQSRLKELKEEMRDAGAKLLAPQTRGSKSGGSSGSSGGNKTATEVSEDAANDNSQLGMMVEDFKDALESMLDMIADYRSGSTSADSESDGGTIEPQPNLDPDQQPIDSATFLLSMSQQGKLSSATLFDEVQKRGLLSEDLTWEDEQKKISDEMGSLGLLPAPGRTVVPGAPGATGPGAPAGAPAVPAPNPTQITPAPQVTS